MDIPEYQKANFKCCVQGSNAPEICKTEPCWLGIDEAGRGPVLGPMVYGTCYAPVSMKDKMKETGVADSKTLDEKVREELFAKLDAEKEWVGWMIDILAPNYLSNSMLKRSKYNLNTLSHDSAIGLIRKVLDLGVNVTEIYVDTVGDPTKYQDKLKNVYPNIDITVAKKADALYPIVSAASIFAKVARDRAVHSWIFSEGDKVTVSENGFGSGYPADPNTKYFLQQNIDPVFGFPHFVRFSWSTAEKILVEKACKVEWDDDEDEENNESTKNTPSLLTHFKTTSKTNEPKSHNFFKDRCLSSVDCF